MKHGKAPRYIWLSALAFAFLWGDTKNKIILFENSFSKNNKNSKYDGPKRWNKAVILMLKLWGGYFMIPMLVIFYVVGSILRYFARKSIFKSKIMR